MGENSTENTGKAKKGFFAGLGAAIKSHKVLSAAIAVLVAGGITTGVLFATGVLGTPSKITEDWLREALAAEGERVIELNNNVKAHDGFEVNGTKTLKGKGKITMAKGAGYVLSINEGAEFTMDGIELNVKNIGTNAVVVREGAKLTWDDGKVSYPKQYAIMNYGDTTINGGVFEYAGASWVYVKSGTTVNVNGGQFVKSTTAGFEVEKNATLNIGGDTYMERAGTNTVNNNGTLVMTGGTITGCELWTITNHGSLDMKNVNITDCALKGSIYNYKEAAKCLIEDCTFERCKTYQIYNEGEVVAKNTILAGSQASTVNNKNTITLENCQILNSNYHAIYNERGTVNIKNLKVDGTVYKAVQNKAGFVTIDGLETDNIGGTAVGNVAVVTGGDYGWIHAKNMTISGATDYGLVSYGGEVTVDDSTFNISGGTTVYVRNGSGIFNNIKVYGSSTPGKAAMCGGSTTWRESVLVVGGSETYITGGSRGISNYGTLTLNDGLITGNKSSGEQVVGAGVYNVGTFTMNGGTITENESASYGGGVRNGTSTDKDTGVKHFGVMYMHGGKITNNFANDNGGGVSIGAAQCGVYMDGGEITGNRCNGKGDGVLVAGTFELSGTGIVDDNEIHIFDQTCKMTVKGNKLAGDHTMVVTSNTWTESKLNPAVQFDDSATRSALSKRFTSGNSQWTLSSDGKMLVATRRDKDINYTDDFEGAEVVTVTDFESLKAAVESTQRGAKKIIKIGANITLESQIELPYNTEIKLIDDGNNRTLKRSADYKGVLFYIRKASTLVAAGEKNLRIDGNAGNVSAKDPMIKTIWGGTFVMEKGAILQNAYNSAYGTADRAGAVNIYGGQFIVKGGLITGCSGYAANEKGVMTNLAAVYGATSSVISVHGGTFSGNNYGVMRTYGRTYVSGGTFTKNNRVGDGGTCIRACNLIINGGTFSENKSSNSGCAIYVTQSDAYPTAHLEINGGKFIDNISSRDTDKGASAGAIYISAKTVAHINACIVSGNVAGKGDGEIALADGSRHGGQSGAGIYNEGTCYIGKDVKVINNTAYNSGGGIYSNGKLYIDGATITGNKTVGVYSGYGGGGAIMLTSKAGESSYASIKNATIENNRTGSSGTIYIDARATVEISDTSISNNIATGESVSGYNSASAILNKTNLTLKNCQINNNTAGAKAAVYTDINSVTVIEDTTFKGNKAAGAAALANTSATTTLKNCVFDGNECQGINQYSNGGAVMNQRKNADSANGQMTIEGCTFKNNAAHYYKDGTPSGGYGGALYNDYGDTVIKDCTFTGNKAANSGKDILNSTNAGKLVLKGTLKAEEIYLNVTKTVTLDSTFKAANKINTIFNTYTSNAKVFDGAASVVAKNATENDGTFVLKTVSDGKVVDKEGYVITTDGYLNGYAATVTVSEESTSYWTLAQAIAAAKSNGGTVTLLRDNMESITVPAGETTTLNGNYMLKGAVDVEGTLNLNNTGIDGGAKVNGTLGMNGTAKVVNGFINVGTTGKINVNGVLTNNVAGALSGNLTVGRQVLTGTVNEDVASKFDLDGDGTLQIDAAGKVCVAYETVQIVSTGTKYDTLAEAVAAAAEGDTIKMLKKVGASSGVTVNKNLTFTSELARNVVSGTVTVASGKTLTLSGSIVMDTIKLGGTGAKVGFGGTLTEDQVATLDTAALGKLGNLYEARTVLLAGDIPANYDRLTLKGAGEEYMLGTDGTVKGYFEAKIGSTYYKTFEDAFSAAEEGETVVLLANAQLNTTLVIDKNVNITTDGVKDRIITTLKQANNDFMLNIKSKITLSGQSETSRLILDGQQVEYNRPVLCVQAEGTAVKYVTVRNSRSTYTGGGAYVNVSGVTFDYCNFEDNYCNKSSAAGGAVYGTGAAGMTFNNCNFTGNGSLGYGAVLCGTYSSSGTFTRFILNNCVADGNTSGDVGGVAYLATGGTNEYGAYFEATDSTFKNNKAAGAGTIRANGGLKLTGCTFENNESSDKADVSIGNTYAFARNIGNTTFDEPKSRAVVGTYTDNGGNVFAPEPVALVEGTEYALLSDAIEAAGDAGTVTLIADIENEGTIAVETNVNINGLFAIKCPVTVAEGKTLSLEQTSIAADVTLNGTLKLTGDSAVTDGKVTVGTNAKIKADAALNAVTAATVTGATEGMQLLTGDTVDNCTRFILDEGLSLDETGKVIKLSNVAKIGTTIYKTFAEAMTAAADGNEIVLLANVPNAEITKNVTVSGAFKLAGTVTVAAGKTLTLKGDIIADTIKLAGAGAKLGFAGTLTASDLAVLDTGSIDTLANLQSAGTVLLAGDIAANFGRLELKDGGTTYSLDENGKVGAYVEAKIGTNKYASLAAAYAAAKSGDTIVLVHDAVLTAGLTTEKALTITTDGIERSISYPTRSGGTYMVYAKSGILKLEGTGENGRLVLDGAGSTTAQRPVLTFQVANCSMKYVTVQNSTSTDGGYGGGAYFNKTGIIIDNCIFRNNKSNGSSGNNGGAIRISASGEATITNSQFLNNYSKTYGGAIMVNASNGKATIDNCLFEGNSAESVGGAIHNNQSNGTGSNVIVTKSVFKNNTVISSSGTGGAIRSTGNFSFDGCTFEGNVGNGDISANTVAYSKIVKNCIFVDKTKEQAYNDGISTITLGDGVTDNNTYFTAE